MKKPCIWYMVVTGDEYELPVTVCDTFSDLVRWTRMSRNGVSCAVHRGGVIRRGRAAGCRLIRITAPTQQNE